MNWIYILDESLQISYWRYTQIISLQQKQKQNKKFAHDIDVSDDFQSFKLFMR